MQKRREVDEILKFLQKLKDSFYEVKEIHQDEAPEDTEFLKVAMVEAIEASHEGEVPVGAVLALGGKIVSKAHNRTEKEKDPTAHAEMIAIREALRKTGSKYLNGSVLYITLEPCLMCFKAASLVRVHRIAFLSYSDEGFSNLPIRSAYPRQITRITGDLSQRYENILREFFENLR